MLSAISLLPLLALGALGQTTVQSVFLAAPSDDNGYVASVVSVANGLTTYDIVCTSGLVYCSTGTTISITEGPSTFGLATETVVSGETASVSETCKIDGTTSATCVAAVSLSVNGISTVTTSTLTIGTDEFHYHPITITAGADKLGSGGATATSSSGAASTASGNAGSPKVTGIGMGAAGAAVIGLAALL